LLRKNGKGCFIFGSQDDILSLTLSESPSYVHFLRSNRVVNPQGIHCPQGVDMPSAFTRHVITNNSPSPVEVLDIRHKKRDSDGKVKHRSSRWKVSREMFEDRYVSKYQDIKSFYDSKYPVYPVLYSSDEVSSGVYVGGELVSDFGNLSGCRKPEYYPLLNSEIHALNKNYFISQVESLFRSYVHDFRSVHKSILLQNKTDGSIVKKFLDNRYDGKYVRAITKRAQFLYMRYRGKPSVLLTLTLDPKKFGYDMSAMWRSLSGKGSEFDRFMKWVRRSLSADGKPCSYLMTIESMHGREFNDFKGRGIPHIHIAFFGIRRIADYKDIESHWDNGYIWINKTRNGETIRSPVDYVIKYVTKTYCEVSDDVSQDVLNQSLTWFFSCRLWNTSRGLVFPLKHSSGEYSACYLLYWSDGVPLDVLGSVEQSVMSDMMYDFNFGSVS
jgi:hypothetical protein